MLALDRFLVNILATYPFRLMFCGRVWRDATLLHVAPHSLNMRASVLTTLIRR